MAMVLVRDVETQMTGKILASPNNDCYVLECTGEAVKRTDFSFSDEDRSSSGC